METDYLIVGSGLSALVFGALMANAGKRVRVLEAHSYSGGFGHTFKMAKKYKFNAQLHYVWNCGEGETVNQVLKRLGLDQQVTFERYDPEGFDRMRMPGYSLDIPSNTEALKKRLLHIFPTYKKPIHGFLDDLKLTSEGLAQPSSWINPSVLFRHSKALACVAKYRNSTLQDVFDKFMLPQEAQTLLALQWPDFLLPPNQLSFFAWVLLFTGYQRGAYYPSQHFEYVIDSLVAVIEANEGEVLLDHEVTHFKVEDKKVTEVQATDLKSKQTKTYQGNRVICNMDPKVAASMIGESYFSKALHRKLDYDYSPSNFVAYCVVKDLDLRDYGFGEWNTFHSGHVDLNEAFVAMYEQYDYSNPSFAITTPTLLTDKTRDCPAGHQVLQFLTVADYDYFKQLKAVGKKAYNKRKAEILESMLDVMEEHYIPNLREHLVYKITGTPTTNERYCWCPQGNSYGSNMTPKNMGLNRLNQKTSLKNLYFCNASSGFAGFAGTFWTGASLYQKLSGERIL